MPHIWHVVIATRLVAPVLPPTPPLLPPPFWPVHSHKGHSPQHCLPAQNLGWLQSNQCFNFYSVHIYFLSHSSPSSWVVALCPIPIPLSLNYILGLQSWAGARPTWSWNPSLRAFAAIHRAPSSMTAPCSDTSPSRGTLGSNHRKVLIHAELFVPSASVHRPPRFLVACDRNSA